MGIEEFKRRNSQSKKDWTSLMESFLTGFCIAVIVSFLGLAALGF